MGITQTILKLRAIRIRVTIGLTPQTINNGNCDNFAADVVNSGFGKAVWGDELSKEWWSEDIQDILEYDYDHFTECHCFIMYKEKFYDSECPQGCDYPDYLPIYQRQLKFFRDNVL